jgi:small-conductance mechanosensitive channel
LAIGEIVSSGDGTSGNDGESQNGGEQKKLINLIRKYLGKFPIGQNALRCIRLIPESISLVWISEFLWEFTSYVLDHPQEITEMSFKGIRTEIGDYPLEGFNPCQITLHAALFIALLLGFYLILYFFRNCLTANDGNSSDKENKTIKILILLIFLNLILILLLCSEIIKEYIEKFGLPLTKFFISTFFLLVFLLCYKIHRVYKEKKEVLNKIKIIAIVFILLIFDLGLCYILRFKIIENIAEPILIKIRLVLIISLTIYWLIVLFKEKSKIQSQFKAFFLINHRWNMPILFCSLFFYFVFCFFLTELKQPGTKNYAGVFFLPLIALIISGGFLICAVIIQRMIEENINDLRSIGVKTEKNWQYTIKMLKRHIESLLADFLVAISSYVFLRVILSIILSQGSSNGAGGVGLVRGFETLFLSQINGNLFVLLAQANENSTISILEKVNQSLSIILLIPLYIFFYRVASTLLENVYNKIYKLIEDPLGLAPYKDRKKYVVDEFVRLTKLILIIFFIISAITKFIVFEPVVDILSKQPVSLVIGTAFAIPVALWLLVLILDPFFEGETIQMGPDRGKIKKVGLFFTHLETMTGEQVYIPNAELLAKTIRRLKIRGPQKEKYEDKESKEIEIEKEKYEDENYRDLLEGEKGIVVYFSCTLTYGYPPKDIERIFRSIFGEIETKEIRKCVNNIRKTIKHVEKEINEMEKETRDVKIKLDNCRSIEILEETKEENKTDKIIKELKDIKNEIKKTYAEINNFEEIIKKFMNYNLKLEKEEGKREESKKELNGEEKRLKNEINNVKSIINGTKNYLETFCNKEFKNIQKEIENLNSNKKEINKKKCSENLIKYLGKAKETNKKAKNEIEGMKGEKKREIKEYLNDIGFDISEEELDYIYFENRPFVYIEEFKDYGVTYRFNFRVQDSLYVPIYRGYFMKKFKDEMEKEKKAIVTPVKFEIKDIGHKEFRW